MDAIAVNIPVQDPLAATVGHAIRAGDIDELKRRLAETPGLASARIVDACGVSRTLLHVVTDWPGHFPKGAITVAVLVESGADVDARVMTPDPTRASETPLHWAASSDDIAVLDALLDKGADIEAPGACIAGGTALDNAVAFGQWHVARRLVARGAQAALWHSAALGLLDDVEAHVAGFHHASAPSVGEKQQRDAGRDRGRLLVCLPRRTTRDRRVSARSRRPVELDLAVGSSDTA